MCSPNRHTWGQAKTKRDPVNKIASRVQICARCGLTKEIRFVQYMYADTVWRAADGAVVQHKGKTPSCEQT